MGIIFILIGICVIISDKYNVETKGDTKEIVKNKNLEKDRLYKYKIVVGVFAIILGTFNILNYILY